MKYKQLTSLWNQLKKRVRESLTFQMFKHTTITGTLFIAIPMGILLLCLFIIQLPGVTRPYIRFIFLMFTMMWIIYSPFFYLVPFFIFIRLFENRTISRAGLRTVCILYSLGTCYAYIGVFGGINFYDIIHTPDFLLVYGYLISVLAYSAYCTLEVWLVNDEYKY